jgi:SOS response regulatory protein OraA/RecX
VTPEDAEAVVEELRHAGLVDDARFAEERARVLAERGKGDAAICFELERAGVGTAEIEVALGTLDPERARAAALVARRGATRATARLLAGRGFDEELVAALVAAEG